MIFEPTKNLEIVAYLSPEEIIQLGEKEVNGKLRFDNQHRGGINMIDVCISLVSKKQVQDVECQQSPSGIYFGRANLVRFLIHKKFYESLVNGGYACNRYYDGTGKLILIDETRKDNLNEIFF